MTKPGTRPVTAVTWNDEIGSKAMPYPARMTIRLLLPPSKSPKTSSFASGLHATPRRGPMKPSYLTSYHLSALMKVTALAVTTVDRTWRTDDRFLRQNVKRRRFWAAG